MRFKYQEMDAGIGVAWEAFARDDAAAIAPPELERRVLGAVQAAAHRRARRTCMPRRRVVLGLAAAALLIAGVSVWNVSQRERPAAPEANWDSAVEATEVVLEGPPNAAQPSRAALVTLAADRIRDTESLQLVRVRMPRGALTALGVALMDPEATGFVDVDVLVGDDGLPLDVRHIRPVASAAAKY